MTTTDADGRPGSASQPPGDAMTIEMTKQASGSDTPPSDQNTRRRKLTARTLGLHRFSGLYVWAALIVLFCIWSPDTFATLENARVIAGDASIGAMLAIALILPLSAGAFDLSIAANLGLSVVTVIELLSHGHNVLLSVAAGIGISVAVGLLNAAIVEFLHVDSFIGTLGMSSVLAAATYFVTNGTQIYVTGHPDFQTIATKLVFGLPLAFYYMLVLAAIIWYVLEYTPLGRRVYAVGGNPQAARLAGVSVRKVIFYSLVAAGLMAGVIGVILSARLSTANTTVGPPYLLPAFSAVFLGTTQILPGRFNVPGTLVAIGMLATGVKGLQLVGAPIYVNDLFNGAALIVAVALAARTRRLHA
jgi:ribose transport system permease protein